MLRPARLSVLLGALALVACHDAASSTPGPSASSTPSADPAPSGSVAPAQAAPLGGPVLRPLRGLDLAVYFAAPAPAAFVAQAQDTTRKRFPGFDLHTAPPPGTKPPTALVFAPPIASFAAPSEQQLQVFGRGLDAAQARTAAASQGVLALSWLFDDDPKHARLRQAQQLVADLASAQAGYVWDEDTRQLFSRDLWKTNRIDGWEGDLPDVRQHITIHRYETDGGRHRSITLGMVKFGLPDLVVEDVPASQADAVTLLMDATAQALVEGASPTASGELALDIPALRHVGARTALTAVSDSDALLKGRITLVSAPAETGDPANRLAGLRFPSYAGATDAERQAAAVSAIVGASRERMRRAKLDPELRSIADRIRDRLPDVAAAFRKGLPLGEEVAVKVPFDTDKKGTEWMWMLVTEWPGPVVRGRLENTPQLVKKLHAGSKVEKQEDEIVDYVWRGADGGRKEGGESVDILRARQPPQPSDGDD